MKYRLKKTKVKREFLSKVQSPDDLEVGEIIPLQARGKGKQFTKEESPDDLEIYDGQREK